jgi:hypothetical protein
MDQARYCLYADKARAKAAHHEQAGGLVGPIVAFEILSRFREHAV